MNRLNLLTYLLTYRSDRAERSDERNVSDPVMLSPRGQTVLEAEILSSASTSALTCCPRSRPRPRASGLGMSSDFVT